MRLFASLFAAFAVLFSMPLKAADWYRAETTHFIVYSEDKKSSTEEFAKDLERLDEVLRILTGVGPDDGSLPETAKVTVFRFGETADMATLAGARGSGIGGFFIGRANGSVAFVPQSRNKRRERGFQTERDSSMSLDPKATLFHEYVHYFMFQHRDAPYPLWYSEGFAELFSNVAFEDDYFVIGDVPPWRSYSLSAIPIDLEKTFDPPAKRDRETTGRTYAHGWLLASHLNLNPERRGQMGVYMQAIAAGKSPMEAAEQAFGDLDQLRDELEEFRKGRARVLKVPYLTKTEPEVAIRKLSDAEAARMDLMIVSKRGVNEEQAARLIGDAEKLVERYPDSAPVLLTAAEAEFDARDYDDAEALAKRVLALDPESVDAAIYLADIAMRRSYEDPSQLAVARQLYIDANNMVTDHAYPLYGYYLTYLFDDSQPVPDDAYAALEAAFTYAPFDQNVRQAIVYMLLNTDRVNGAKVVGNDWIAGKGGFQCMVRKQFDEFENGNKEPLLETIKPDHPGKYMDQDARKAERERIEKQIEDYGCKVD